MRNSEGFKNVFMIFRKPLNLTYFIFRILNNEIFSDDHATNDFQPLYL